MQPPMLTLKPMSEADYEHYLDTSAATYAEQFLLSGLPACVPAQIAAHAYTQAMLPQGVATPGHFLMTLQDAASNTNVGSMWFSDSVPQQSGHKRNTAKGAFLHFLQIDTPYRRRGLANMALQQLLETLRQRGIRNLSLNVFAHNAAAQMLYRKVGFCASEITMTRTL